MSMQCGENERAAGGLIVDIGKKQTTFYLGTEEIHSTDFGMEVLNNAIIEHIKRCHKLSIKERAAEDIAMRISCVSREIPGEDAMNVTGCDLQSGLPKTIHVTDAEINGALQAPLAKLLQAIRDQLIKCSPELGGQIITHGIMLTGCGAALRGLDKLILRETAIPVVVNK